MLTSVSGNDSKWYTEYHAYQVLDVAPDDVGVLEVLLPPVEVELDQVYELCVVLELELGM